MLTLSQYSGIKRKDFDDKKAMVFDIDNTIVTGRIANSALYLISEERKKGNWGNFIGGIWNGAKIAAETKVKGYFGDKVIVENDGLRHCVKTLGKSGITKKEIHHASEKYVDRHAISGIFDLVDTLKKDYGLEPHISSLTADTFAEPIAKKFDCDFTTQKIIYDGDIPYDLEVRMVSPLEKLTETRDDLSEKGISMKDVIYFGDSESDIFFMNSYHGAGMFICSPKTTDRKIRKNSDIKLNWDYDYDWLNDELVD